MEQLSILLLGGLVLVLMIGVWSQYHRNKNREAAWLYRQRIAEIAFEIETDSEAPDKVREFICYLADEAFNEHFLRRVYVASRRTRHSNVAQAQDAMYAIGSNLKVEFGEYYGVLLYEAINAFAHIALYADIASGLHLRSQSASQEPQPRPASIGDAIIDMASSLLGQNDKHGGGHGHVHA